jgi:hypothetical protein
MDRLTTHLLTPLYMSSPSKSKPIKTARRTKATKPKRIPSTVALNKHFQKMTPIQKRHAIARDALERLAMGQLKPVSGEWIRLPNDYMGTLDLQSILMKGKKGAVCEVCALGGALCGIAAFEDKVHMKVHDDRFRRIVRVPFEDSVKRLIEIFGIQQAILIEHVFERGEGSLSSYTHSYCQYDLTDDEFDAAFRFYNLKKHQTERALFKAVFTLILNHPEGLLVLP